MNTSSPSRTKGYKALHKSQCIAAPRDSFVVATEEVARLLDERIEHLNVTQFRGDTLSPKSEAGVGAVASVVHGAVQASHGTLKFDQVTRRLWSIRARECRAVNIGMADALLMGAGVNIEETDLATLPAGDIAAHEAVEIHRELVDPEMNDLDAKRLEHTLLHFSQGYIHEFNVIDQQVAKGLEAFFAAAAPRPDYRQLALA